MKLQLWGLPASGTTIIVRYFHSLPDAFFLTEPLHRIAAHNLDLERELDRELDRPASIVGYKECVHLPDMPWFHQLKARPGWTTICMVRDPLEVWKSMLMNGWGLDSGRKVKDFISFAVPFLETIRQYPTIVYERFSEDPAAEVERTTGLKFPVPATLRKLSDSFGDPMAHQSASVRRFEALQVSVPEDDLEDLDRSGLHEAYGKLAEKAHPRLVPR
jgi:hypothetical protein